MCIYRLSVLKGDFLMCIYRYLFLKVISSCIFRLSVLKGDFLMCFSAYLFSSCVFLKR